MISGEDVNKSGQQENVFLKTPGLTITTTASVEKKEHLNVAKKELLNVAKKESLNNSDESISSSEECNRSTLDDYR